MNIKNEALEQIVQLVTNDNLDLGCAAIEQAATEKVCARDYIPAFSFGDLKKKRNRFSLACRHYFLLGIIPSCPYFIWLGLFIKLSDILCLFLSRQYKLLMRTLTSNCCYGKSIEMVPDPPFLIRTCYRRILLVLYQSPSVQNRDIYPCLNSEFMRWVF